uniref:Ig-like domain-containing protein n=1 Tax=Gallus gallus TaxID=9031 RepID=A0A8V0ZYR1_CHICK
VGGIKEKEKRKRKDTGRGKPRGKWRGNSVQLSCQGSGFNFGSYGVRWYRQALGGRLEWLSFITGRSYTVRYSPGVEGRATVSRDNSRSVSYLSLHALNPHDSAHYLCALRTGTVNPEDLHQKTSSWAQPQLWNRTAGRSWSSSWLFLDSEGTSLHTTDDPVLSLMHYLGSVNSGRISPFLCQKPVHISLTGEGCVSNFFFDRELSCCHSMDSGSFDCLVVVTPCLIIVNDVTQETATLSCVWVQLFLTNLHTLFFLFLGESL